MGSFHQPVLLKEAVDYLKVRKGGKYIDATVGGGNHAASIVLKGGKVLGIDLDPEAIKAAREHLFQACPFRDSDLKSEVGTSAPWRLAQGNFAHLKAIAEKERFLPVAGVLFDLGVSSYQLEAGKRGFSFNSDAPLDMRMDPGLGVTAADLVNGLNRGELNELFTRLGQEKYSRRFSAAILSTRRVRPIKTGRELAEVIKKAFPKKKSFGKIHPATKVFMALRMAVNDELNNLRKGLNGALEVLEPGGRLVAISFHSGEDRIVKQFLKEEEKIEVVTKKPVVPTKAEVEANPRSRSAKLRAGKKIKNES